MFNKRDQYVVSRVRKLSIISLILFLATISGQLPGLQDLTGYAYIPTTSVLSAISPQGSSVPSVGRDGSQKVSQVIQGQIGETKIIETNSLSIPQVTSDTNGEEWGKAKQLDEHTWTMKVTNDSHQATPSEILNALNEYRAKKGRGELTWDDKLATYAQQRTDYFKKEGKLDGHGGFMEFVNNGDGFNKLEFGSLGENSSLGYTLEGVHLIEWVYAGDKPHDDNQLNQDWTHVGVGVSGTATNLIFGGKKRD